MKLANKEIGLSIIVKDELITKLYSLGKKHSPNEYGGIMVGYYSEDKKSAFFEHTLLPQKYESSRFKFERGSEGLKEELTKLYEQTPPLIYIGEWHTHPGNPPIPSKTDLNAITEIVNDENVLITNPILLIISLYNRKYELGFYVYFNNNMYKYEEE